MKRLIFSLFFCILTLNAIADNNIVKIAHPKVPLAETKVNYNNNARRMLAYNEKLCTRFGINLKRVTTVYYTDRSLLHNNHNLYMAGMELIGYGFNNEGTSLIAESADKGDVDAQLYLGKKFDKMGKFLDASIYYSKAARQGCAEAVALLWVSRANAAVNAGIAFGMFSAGTTLAVFMNNLGEMVGEEAIPGKKCSFSDLPDNIAKDIQEFMNKYTNVTKATALLSITDLAHCKIVNKDEYNTEITLPSGRVFWVGKQFSDSDKIWIEEEGRSIVEILVDKIPPKFYSHKTFQSAYNDILNDERERLKQIIQSNDYQKLFYKYL